jgi:hypothetical protein
MAVDAFPNAFASLPGDLAQRAAALVAKREAEGLNVHFINERGEFDRYSMASPERASALRASLQGLGRTVFD